MATNSSCFSINFYSTEMWNPQSRLIFPHSRTDPRYVVRNVVQSPTKEFVNVKFWLHLTISKPARKRSVQSNNLILFGTYAALVFHHNRNYQAAYKLWPQVQVWFSEALITMSGVRSKSNLVLRFGNPGMCLSLAKSRIIMISLDNYPKLLLCSKDNQRIYNDSIIIIIVHSQPQSKSHINVATLARIWSMVFVMMHL